jgi:hypothetical protein
MGGRPVTRKKKPEIPYKNRSPYGWWIASYLERFEYYDEDRRNLNRRCLAYENTILVKAQDREEAWRKAVTQGRLGQGSDCSDDTGRRGSWHFEGLTSLLPVYDELVDGAEVLWAVHAGRSVRKIRALVKGKRQLEVFKDRSPDRSRS